MLALAAVLATPVLAQVQFAELGKRHFPAVVAPTMSLASGDVDGDGDLDLIVGMGYDIALQRGQQHRLYLNDGAGTFTDATTGRMPLDSDWTHALALGDVDGDGDLDLILGNDQQQNRLYLNNGAGVFTDATAGRMPAVIDRTQSLALGDVDGDGDLDLLVGNGIFHYGAQNKLYRNNGAGVFSDATATHLPAHLASSGALALGDLDGDGDLDLIAGNTRSPGEQNQLYLNDGAGVFSDATATRLPAETTISRALALADFDRDGDLDLFVGNSGRNRLYRNDGTGTFTDVSGNLPVVYDDTFALVVGDFDRDGDLDVLVGNQGQNRLLLNFNATGQFTDVTAARLPAANDDTRALMLGDFDRDLDVDLCVGNQGHDGLAFNNGAGVFRDARGPRTPTDAGATTSLAVGDLDRDGDLDVVVGRTLQRPGLYLNDGLGTLTDGADTRMPIPALDTRALALGDVDRDGDLDLILGNWGDPYGAPNRLYRNDGAGRFTDVTATRMPAFSDSTLSLALGDVDGDGAPDLVVGNGYNSLLRTGEPNRLYLNHGAGTFRDATAGRLPPDTDSTSVVLLGDVDRDGDLDLLVGNSFPFLLRLYANDGTGRFTEVTATHLPANSLPTLALAFGDVDGDGDLDLLHAVQSGARNRLYLNDGAGVFTDATAGRLPALSDSTTSLVFGDVDDDGDFDLVVGNGLLNMANRILLNDGTGTFTDATTTRLSPAFDDTRALALADFDRDGDLDLLVGNHLQQTQLHHNLLRHLDAPFLLRAGQAYRLDAYARHGPMAQSDVAAPHLAFGRADLPFPPFGTLGIDPSLMVALPLVLIPQPAGVGSLSLPIPNVAHLDGVAVYTQALLWRHPVETLLTNVVGDVFLR